MSLFGLFVISCSFFTCLRAGFFVRKTAGERWRNGSGGVCRAGRGRKKAVDRIESLCYKVIDFLSDLYLFFLNFSIFLPAMGALH